MTLPSRPVRRDLVAEPGIRRRRRPSGDTASLPRPIYTSGRLYLGLSLVVGLGWAIASAVPSLADLVAEVDDTVRSVLGRWHRAGVVDAAEVVRDVAADGWWRAVALVTAAAGLAFGRVRHVVVLVGVVLVATAFTTAVEDAAIRPVLSLVGPGVAAVGIMYVLVPRGVARNRSKLVVAAAMTPLVAAHLYLGADAGDVVVSMILGFALPVLAFRYLVPDPSFPVRYRPAAPRLTSEEVDAIRRAMAVQLGWDVESVEPLRPPGSAGSTPLRVALGSGSAPAPSTVFAKLYSLKHVRSDRWYKLARAILYGRLEDEAPFTTVRQMVEHEDYLCRVVAGAGLPVPETFGVLELAPGREYLLVLEDLADGGQLGESAVTVEIVDQGLDIVARLWESGLAHRDIKPANLVVERGRLLLVDLSFGEVAATPWRQAVDLADMMLSLGLYLDPTIVYERALRRFSPDEIAEAFATTATVTIPAQLRRLLRERAPDLVQRFTALAPGHPPISIQRWSGARIALTAGVLGVVLSASALLVVNLETVGLL